MSDVSHVEIERITEEDETSLFPLENLLSNGSKMDATLKNPSV